MTFDEAVVYMRGLQKMEQTRWEQTRCIMWAALTPHCKKRLEYKDIMTFPWEKEYIDTSKVDKGELKRIKELANKIKGKL
jgi:hypothetical protein